MRHVHISFRILIPPYPSDINGRKDIRAHVSHASCRCGTRSVGGLQGEANNNMDAPHRRHAGATTTVSQSSAADTPAPLPQRRARSSKRLAAAALEMTPEATIVTDVAGTIRLVNRQTAVLFGYPREELLAQSVEVLVPNYLRAMTTQPRWRPNSDPDVDPDHAAHLAPVGVAIPLLGRRRDGHEFPVEIRFAHLEQDGEPLLIASVHEMGEARDMARVRGEVPATDNRQLRRVLAVTDTALAHLDLDTLLPELLPRVRDVMDADLVAILLLDADGQHLTVRAESRVAGDGPGFVPIPMPVGVGLAGRVAATRQPLVVDDVARFPLARPLLRQAIHSAMGVPLLTAAAPGAESSAGTGEQRLLGVLCVGTARPQHFSPQDVALLEQAATRITTAIERAQLFAAEQAARREAERERARWHAAMENAPEFVITCDADLRMTYVNPAYARLRGGPADPALPAEERPGRYGLFLPDGEHLFPVEQLPLTRALKEGRPVHGVQMVLRTPQGEERLVEWDAAPKRTAQGEVLGAVAIGHDITARQRAEEALRATEARFRAAFESAAIGVALVDPSGRPLEVNDYITKMVGYSKEELRRLSLVDFTHPDDVEANVALIRRVRDGEHDSYQLEKRYLHKNGHVVWGLTSAAVVRNQAGQPAYFVVHVEDITQRKQLERTTQELAAQLQATLDTMSDAVFLDDTAGQPLQLNAAARELVSAFPGGRAVQRMPWQERFRMYRPRRSDGSPLPLEEWPLARVLRGEALTAGNAQDVVMTDAQGRDLVLNYRGGPARDAAGQLLGYVFVVRDVTERRRLQREREEALAASEAWFRSLTDTVPALVWVSGPDGLVTFVNQPWLQFTGRTLKQELGDGWAEGVHPEDYDHCLQTYRAAFDARQPFTMEYRLRHADGEYRWLVDTGVPRFAPDGTFLGYIGSVMDISDRRQLEQEREAARAQAERRAEELDRVFEAMTDGVAVYDQDGQIVRANAALRRLLGFDAAPAVPAFAQLSLRERFSFFAARDEHGRPVPPEEGPLLRALAGEVLAGAEALEGRLRTLDGREVELRVSAAPLRTLTGQLAGAVCVYRDVTEPKRLERELATQAEQLDRIVESMGEGLFVYDAQGQVVRANRAARRLLGLDAVPSEFYRLPAEKRMAQYAPRTAEGHLLTPQAWLALREARDGDALRAPEARDLRLRTLDGREREVSASMAPLRQPDGQVGGGVLLLSDRTERNQLVREREEARARELAAQELAEQLDQFFAMASHDIRSPVTALSGAAQYARLRLQRLVAGQQQQVRGIHAQPQGHVQDADPTTTPLATALDLVQTSVQSLSRLVDRLFDVARARSGALALDLAVVDLAALVREQVAVQQRVVPERRIQMRLPKRPVPVVGDALRLDQVVSNYLTNALKYSPDEHPVMVRLEVTNPGTGRGTNQGARAQLSVEDRGVGLSPEQQTHVWDLYHRGPDVPMHMGASANLESLGVGLGLGLYIVKRLVELHPGGQVGVDSVVGQGSTFWLSLPIAESAP